MQAQSSNPKGSSFVIGQQIMNLNRVYSTLDSNHCGYCNKNGSQSWSFIKQVMFPYTYQMLMERGWRRSGTYFYKPSMATSCCKLWTHRMDVNKFKIKKDQKKTVRHVVQWLISKMGNKQNKKKQLKPQSKVVDQKMQKQQQKKPQKADQLKKYPIPQKYLAVGFQTAQALQKIINQKKAQFVQLFQNKLQSQEKLKQFIYKIQPNKVRCFMGQENSPNDFYANHLMLLFGINKKAFKKDYGNIQFVNDIGKFVLKQLNQIFQNSLVIQTERSGYLLFTFKDGPKMLKNIKKQQAVVLENENKKKPQKLNKHTNSQKKQVKNMMAQGQKMKQQALNKFQLSISSSQICFGPLTILIVPAEITTESWKMYQRYSVQIHQKQQKSQQSYSGFLCEKALKFLTETKNHGKNQIKYLPSWQQQDEVKYFSSVKGQVTKMLGCYHMKYYIEKQLVGVGVVDILPEGLSSVYFFYQPKYKDLRLGVFSSLIEIQYVRWLSLSFPQFRYYYMGFYIQNCQKMNYKGNYEPFDLMCPVTYRFVQCTDQIRQLITKIQKKQIKQVQLSPPGTQKLPDMNFTTDIGVFISQKLRIKYQGKMLTLRDLNPLILPQVLRILRDMAKVWGKELFQKFTFTF